MSSTPDYECIAINCVSIVVVLLYCPPDGKKCTFFEFVCSVLQYTSSLRLKVIIVVDENIDLLVENTHQVEFLTFIQSFACFTRINSPTRVTDTSSTLLDPCITNFHSHDVLSGVITAGISYHMPICLVFCLNLKKFMIHLFHAYTVIYQKRC